MVVSIKKIFFTFFLFFTLLMVNLIHTQSSSISVFLTAKLVSLLHLDSYSVTSLRHLLCHLRGHLKEWIQSYPSGQQGQTTAVEDKQRCILFYQYTTTFWYFYFNVSQPPRISMSSDELIICWLKPFFFPIFWDLSPKSENRNHPRFLLSLSLSSHYLSCWVFIVYFKNIS